MDYRVGDVVLMRKKHPCGSFEWTITRVGMDFKLRCNGCGHEIMIIRFKAERAIKKLVSRIDDKPEPL